jgi:nitrogen-specific signal transduction histidine kinase
MRHTEDAVRLIPLLNQSRPSLLIFDLRAPQGRDLLASVRMEMPGQLIIALAAPRSAPAREAEALGVYAVEDVEPDRLRFQSLLNHAMDRLQLQSELDTLRESPPPVSASPLPGTDHATSAMPLHYFSRALRRFDNPDALLDSIVEGLASSAKVARVGMVAQLHRPGPFQLRAGLRCLEESRSAEFDESHPLPRWLEVHAHLVSRAGLEHIPDASERLMLKQALDMFGAELLVPLFARGRLTGWIFFGKRSTGLPFEQTELDDLVVLTDHVSTTLENAQLYEEVALQKTLAETLFHSMPTGIAAVGADGFVRWYNDTAAEILNKPADAVLNKPVSALGSRLADMLHRAFIHNEPQPAQEWLVSETKRYLSVQSRPLHDRVQNQNLGAVALIQDITDQQKLKEKEDQLERAAFWTDLAAGMSHEIRNPLVAIKTFAQLLPQRFDDPEFRAEFSKMVGLEVDRLNNIIDQINNFANPPTLQFKRVDIEAIVQSSIEEAKSRAPHSQASIHAHIEPHLPAVDGDPHALRESLTHLIVNALEALPRKENARVDVKAQRWMNPRPSDAVNGSHGDTTQGVHITVGDNGHGIAPDIKDKIFSPFCTTKARGMGLGLPIVKRTAVDHDGQVDIESSHQGTTVSLFLPKAHQPAPIQETTHFQRA